MTIDYRYLRSHLQKLLDVSISEPELSGLVQFCRSICQSHLQNVRASVVHLALRQGLTITDLAYDCIAEAFARDAKGAFTQLENFAESLRGSLADLPDHEIFLAFKSLGTA